MALFCGIRNFLIRRFSFAKDMPMRTTLYFEASTRVPGNGATRGLRFAVSYRNDID